MSDNEKMPSEFQSPVKSEQYTSELPEGWHKPKPEVLPKPGYWPFLLALGIAFILWGLAVGFNEVFSTIVIVSGLGLILFIVALAGWIGDLRDERKHENE
jgi:uncharacterized membrane protein HdeD (DUF308 family)